VPGRTKDRQHPILHFEHADNFVLAYYASGDTQPKGLPFAGEPEIEPEPGAWAALDQRGQTVHGPQTNIAGDARGPVLSGTFPGPVVVGGGEAADLRGARGAVYKPTGLEALDLAPSPEATRLHRILRTRLDLEEFRTLCFDLGVRYDALGGETLDGKARELVLRLQQRGYDTLGGETLDGKARELVLRLQQRGALERLTGWIRENRPDVALGGVLPSSPRSPRRI
jgi:uncharacterized protein YggL (DUF469 family)